MSRHVEPPSNFGSKSGRKPIPSEATLIFESDLTKPVRTVDIKDLKKFVRENLSKNSTLRDILLAEDDELEAYEFSAKVDVWLKLLRNDT